MAKDEINAFLGTGTSYEGRLVFQGSVRMDGEFSGEVCSEGTLIVGKDARLNGTFQVGQMIISGTVDGDLAVSGKLVLHGTAKVGGSMRAGMLVVEEGAKLDGHIEMGGREGHAEKGR